MGAARAVRIDIRATQDLKDLLQEAATLSGVTLTAFVTQAAAASARGVLAQHRVITPDPATQDRLREAIEWLHREHGDVLQRLAQ